MGYSHNDKPTGVNGLFVGAKGSEVQVASSTGQLYQSGTAVSGTAAELSRGRVKMATGALAAVDTAGGLFSWANPETGTIIVQHVALVIGTKTTGACTADVGTTAASATTLSDNLIDGKDINAAAGTFTNLESAGTNGKAGQRLASGKWVTGSVASGASAGIVGTYEIYYIVL